MFGSPEKKAAGARAKAARSRVANMYSGDEGWISLWVSANSNSFDLDYFLTHKAPDLAREWGEKWRADISVPTQHDLDYLKKELNKFVEWIDYDWHRARTAASQMSDLIWEDFRGEWFE